MSNPNPDRNKRVRQIREIVNGPNYYHEGQFYKSRYDNYLLGDALLLLQECVSLLDSQAALGRELAIIVDVATDEDPGTSLSKLHKIQYDAATRMRDRCVEKVREIRDEWNTNAEHAYAERELSSEVRLRTKEDAADELITALESLTLEGGGETEMSTEYKPIHTPVYTQADLDQARKEARAAAFKEIRARIEAANPKLSFGSANGSVMKKCVLTELYELEAKND